MMNYRRELFREMIGSTTETTPNKELREWSRLMQDRERRIFDLMDKEASQRLSSGTSLPTHEDKMNETIKKGMWVPPTKSNK
ncbi:MAG: hypothetical protein HOC91_10570 [Nitrospinaceae bacterium]|jgi:hypothetical protein|nr:hypothetical protein [Nitrospinaceae bacterium]MBT3433453.1 hypothetical protein [Nitrospinaceae bacterium]MBT3820171.1 hypothetical protein [Nitrospinaceae bacterium]MBT4094928.1 hypothetical protein [Nitrospinaceae bacterium]MBT4430948.1 hypothetical protein [Nitrospinaceae bacterium]